MAFYERLDMKPAPIDGRRLRRRGRDTAYYLLSPTDFRFAPSRSSLFAYPWNEYPALKI